jgi:hypothetical protein
MRRRRAILAVIATVTLISVLLVGGSVAEITADSTQTSEVTVEGTSLTVTSEQGDDLKETISAFADLYPVETGENVFLLESDDGTSYIVSTDQTPIDGKATVTGTVIDTDSDSKILFADSADFSTKGKPVELSELQSNPEAYDLQLVRVTADYRQLSFAEDLAEGRQYQATGVLAEPHIVGPSTKIGNRARFATLNLSSGEFGADRNAEIEQELGWNFGSMAGISDDAGEFWIEGETTVDAIVLADQGKAGLKIVDTTPVTEATVSPNELSENGDQYTGEVVTVEGQAVGTKSSSKRWLESVANCGPELVITAPVPPGCLPVVTDSTMHSGVLFEGTPETPDEVVPYAGLSNTKVGGMTAPEQGTYSVTGRVVASEDIDPNLPEGYAVVAYDMERQGELSATQSAVDEATSIADSVTDPLREQLNTSRAYGDGSSAADGGKETSGEPDLAITDRGFAKQQVPPGEPVVVEATVRNRGDAAGEMNVSVSYPGGQTVETTTVSVPAGSSETVEFRHARPDEGAIRLYVNGEDIGMARYVPESDSDDSESEKSADDDEDSDASGENMNDAQTADDQTSLIDDPPMPSMLYGAGLGGVVIGGLLSVVGSIVAIASWRSDEAYNESLINWTFGIGYTALFGGLAVAGWAKGEDGWIGLAAFFVVVGLLAVWLQLVWVYSQYAIGAIKRYGTQLISVFKE